MTAYKLEMPKLASKTVAMLATQPCRVSAGRVRKFKVGLYTNHLPAKTIVRKLTRSAKGSGRGRKARKFLLRLREDEAYALQRILWLREQLDIRRKIDDLADRFAGLKTSSGGHCEIPSQRTASLDVECKEWDGGVASRVENEVQADETLKRRRSGSIVVIPEVVVSSSGRSPLRTPFTPKPESDSNTPDEKLRSSSLRARAQFLAKWSKQLSKQQLFLLEDQQRFNQQKDKFEDELVAQNAEWKRALQEIQKQKADLAKEKAEIDATREKLRATEVHRAWSRRRACWKTRPKNGRGPRRMKDCDASASHTSSS